MDGGKLGRHNGKHISE